MYTYIYVYTYIYIHIYIYIYIYISGSPSIYVDISIYTHCFPMMMKMDFIITNGAMVQWSAPFSDRPVHIS